MECVTDSYVESAGVSRASESVDFASKSKKMRDVLDSIQERYIKSIENGFDALRGVYENILEEGKIDCEPMVQGHAGRILHIFNIAKKDLERDLETFSKHFGEFKLDGVYFGLLARYVKDFAERIESQKPDMDQLRHFLSTSEQKMKDECDIVFEAQKMRFLSSVESSNK